MPIRGEIAGTSAGGGEGAKLGGGDLSFDLGEGGGDLFESESCDEFENAGVELVFFVEVDFGRD